MIEIGLLLILGMVGLYFGADWVVKGGVHIAGEFKLSHIVIGLTIVAFGTSLPELVVSLNAALAESETIAIGNVVGSNIANVGLVLGVSSLIFPITILMSDVKRDLAIYIVILIVFIAMIWDGQIIRWEGAVLVFGIIAYTFMCYRRPLVEIEEPETHFNSLKTAILAIFAGILSLWIGSEVFVHGAVQLARLWGVSEIVIGMSIVAFGTSLPEFATSIVAAWRQNHAISIGNIIGSNIFNILSVLGITAFITPLHSPAVIMRLEIPVMVLFGAVLFPLALVKQPVSRWLSVIIIGAYILFLVMLFTR